jgi:DEAD/DEAH box helicase domain-containing protein
VLEQRPVGTGQACLGEVFAVLRTPLYEKVHFYTLDRISQHPAEVAPVAYEAMSFWVTVPEALSGEVARLGLDAASGMKGVLYCVSRVLPLFLTSDANDFDWSLGSRNTPWHTMFWYEFFLQGIGHAEQAYQRLEEILGVTLEQLLTCDCDDGCPNCTSRLITPYYVRNIELGEGWVASRRAAAVVLRSLLSGEPAAESLALVDSPRDKRGMRYLPSVTGEVRRRGDSVSLGVLPPAAEVSFRPMVSPTLAFEETPREPHRLPLDERLRQLMLRKLERARSPRQPVDHPIDLRPPLGAPPPEPEESLRLSDAASWSSSCAVSDDSLWSMTSLLLPARAWYAL